MEPKQESCRTCYYAREDEDGWRCHNEPAKPNDTIYDYEWPRVEPDSGWCGNHWPKLEAECSKCETRSDPDFFYCPWCGKKMREEGEADD